MHPVIIQFVEWHGGPEFSRMGVSTLLEEIQQKLSVNAGSWLPSEISRVFIYSYFVGSLEDWGLNQHPEKTVKRIWRESVDTLCISVYVKPEDVSFAQDLLIKQFFSLLRTIFNHAIEYFQRKKLALNEVKMTHHLAELECELLQNVAGLKVPMETSQGSFEPAALSFGIRFECSAESLWILQQVRLINLINDEILRNARPIQEITIAFSEEDGSDFNNPYSIRLSENAGALHLRSESIRSTYAELQSSIVNALEEMANEFESDASQITTGVQVAILLRLICLRYRDLKMEDVVVTSDECYQVASEFVKTGKLVARDKL